MGYITAERGQGLLLGYSLDEFVEKDSKCRYIVKLLEMLDLTQLYSNYKSQGAEYYDPKIILAIWFLAYCEGIASSRKIEQLCRKHMDFIYISANLRPDHSTLCRFMQRNKALWPDYFLQILRLAMELGISDFKQIMMDGSKFRARSSKKQCKREREIRKYIEAVRLDIQRFRIEISQSEEAIKEREAHLEAEAVETEISEVVEAEAVQQTEAIKQEAVAAEAVENKAEENKAEENKAEENKAEEKIDELEKLKKEKEKLERNKKQLRKLEQREKQYSESLKQLTENKGQLEQKYREECQITMTEHDARIMDQGMGKGYHPCYNVFAGVDVESHLIVSFNVTTQRNDLQQFSQMHRITESNLGGLDKTDNDKEIHDKRIYGADSGFNSFEQLVYVKKHKVNAYIQDSALKALKKTRGNSEEILKSGRKLQHADFIYERISDSYRCPMGERLYPSKTSSTADASANASTADALTESSYYVDSSGRKRAYRKSYRRKDCTGCPLFFQCLGEKPKGKGKNLKGDPREYLAEEMRLKLQSPLGEEIMMKRQTSVETVFGEIKENRGFRRFRTRGLENVTSETAFIFTAININKLFRLLRKAPGGLFWLYQHFLSIIMLFRLTVNPLKALLSVRMNFSPVFEDEPLCC